jgi:hypothetical protein
MLLHRKGTLTIEKSKSSRLSYSEVVSQAIFEKYKIDPMPLSTASVLLFIANTGKHTLAILK